MLNLRDDLINLCQRGGFNLGKWGSNNPVLTKNFSSKNAKAFMSIDPTETIKPLGLHWDAVNDIIFYIVKDPAHKTWENAFRPIWIKLGNCRL